MKIKEDRHTQLKQVFSQLRTDRLPWWNLWRTLGDFYIPTRMRSLESPSEASQSMDNRNSKILDATGTMAGRILGAGLLNGITSPARPWLKLRIAGLEEEETDHESRLWLDDSGEKMHQVFAESNFYNSMSTLYTDIGFFGTSAMPLYEDPEKVIHCENPRLGEYYLMLDAKGRVCGFARDFTYTVYQMVQEFGLENCHEQAQAEWKLGGASHLKRYAIVQLVEPNLQNTPEALNSSFEYREYFWTASAPNGEILRLRGFYEFPIIVGRWEVSGSSAYATSCPGMDALGDVIQLQHETKKKGQGLDLALRPPMLLDIMLEHKPTSMLPGGQTFVPRLSDTAGAKPMFTVDPPLQEISQDILDVRRRIQDHFHNALFNRILTLETVRSAEEIRGIDAEKLILVGPTLQRVYSETIDKAVNRTYAIMVRRNMFLPPPAQIQGRELRIQYVSLFSAAQNAALTAPVERLYQVVGNLSAIWPEAPLNVDVSASIQEYAANIGVQARHMRSLKEVRQIIQQQNAQTEQQSTLDASTQLAEGAKTLSETDVGGGANVLQRMLEGYGAQA